jgi:NADP-dependent 3-hydroxy acid dehydrogenase YdfG
MDVADAKQVATMVQAPEKKYGRIEVLVNAAGVLFTEQYSRPLMPLGNE